MGLTNTLKTAATTARKRWAPYLDPSAGPLRQAGQVATIISVVVIGVVALIGVLIFAQINDALPAPADPQLDNASTSITEGFSGAVELIPVVMLVLIAALVIGVVQRMRMS